MATGPSLPVAVTLPRPAQPADNLASTRNGSPPPRPGSLTLPTIGPRLPRNTPLGTVGGH
jgi:hypothetical protein